MNFIQRFFNACPKSRINSYLPVIFAPNRIVNKCIKLSVSKLKLSYAPDFSNEWCKQITCDSDSDSSIKRTTVMSTMDTSCEKNSHNGNNNGMLSKTPFLIGVAGGTASGKSTVCKRIMEKLGQDDIDHSQRRVVCISQDAFYRTLSAEEASRALKGAFNFDHPDAFDNELILRTLHTILDGKICEIPNYDYVTNSRLEGKTTIYPADVVLFEGILMFYQPEIRSLFHMKLFVDSDADTRLARRVMRDTNVRGRQLEQVLTQYTKLVKPAFEEFCLPTKKFADVIIPRGAENTVAINLIVQHIQEIVNHKKESREHSPLDNDTHIR